MQRPDGSATMSDEDAACELAGSDGSLISLIESGEVPKPALMAFNDWQKWRRDVGRRPKKRRNGTGTGSNFEAKLWRSCMNNLHGGDWLTDLYAQ